MANKSTNEPLIGAVVNDPADSKDQHLKHRKARFNWLRTHPEEDKGGEYEALVLEFGESEQALSGGVPADTIAAPGIIYDEHSGKSWTLPTDAMFDAGAVFHRSPYEIKKDPRFHYEFHHKREFGEMLSQEFVPVTRKELGITELNLPGNLARPFDGYYVVGDDGANEGDVCMKIPKEIAALRYKALKSVCDAARDAVKVRGETRDARFTPDRDLPIDPKFREYTDSREPTE